MPWNVFIVLFAVVIKSGFGLDCTQIPPTSIFDGSTVYLPGPSDQLQIIPANWNCLYNISAPANTKNGLFANVLIRNELRGVNDYIRVTDMWGEIFKLNGNAEARLSVPVIPGTEVTIQVVTKSVYMQSKFEITVTYSNVEFGPTFPMKTGGEMNYFDLASLRDGKSLFNSVTFVGTEPIYVSLALLEDQPDACYECLFIIDGTIDNRTQISSSDDVAGLGDRGFTTKSNAITILSSNYKFSRFVFNPKSEADKFYNMRSLAVDYNENNGNAVLSENGKPNVFQVVNFETNGDISMHNYKHESQKCTAYVVSGPPNNSSKVLLDLSTSPKMPHYFDVQYFSVIAEDCDLRFYVRGY